MSFEQFLHTLVSHVSFKQTKACVCTTENENSKIQLSVHTSKTTMLHVEMFQTTTNEHWCRKCCKTPCDWELFGLHNQRAWVNSLHCNRVSVTDDLYRSNFESLTSRTRCFYLAIIPLHGNPGIGHLYWIVFIHLELIWSTLYSVYLQVKEDEGRRKEDEERRKEKTWESRQFIRMIWQKL